MIEPEIISTPSDGDEYLFKVSGGILRAYLYRGEFHITYMEVQEHSQRQGRGTELVNAAVAFARAHAQALGISAVSASVYSAEMYGLVQKNFGPDYLDIKTQEELSSTSNNAIFVYPVVDQTESDV